MKLAALIIPSILIYYLMTKTAQADSVISSGTVPPTTGGTLGERNNNPGNIRFDPGWTWRGQTGKDNNGFVIFDYVENGIRAIGKDLLTKNSRGINTISAIISVYAPPSENNTGAYIDALSAFTGFNKNAKLNLTNRSVMFILVKGIIKHENGRVSYSDAIIYDGVDRALS